MKYIAVLRFKDKQGKIIGFRLKTTYSSNNVTKDLEISDVKKLLDCGVIVENLKLTSDNRIIEIPVNKQEKVKLELFKNGVPQGVYYVDGTHDTCDIRVQNRKTELLFENPGAMIHSSVEVTSAVDKIRNIIARYDANNKRFKPYIMKNIKKNYDYC